MNFELGANNAADLLTLSGGSLTVSGPTVLNFTELTTPTIGTYNLITYQSATGTSNFQLGSLALSAGLAGTLQATGGTEQLVISLNIPPQAYWQGPGTTWSTAGNWSSDLPGANGLTRLPGANTDLFFATTGGTATIDQNFNVNSLNLASSNSVTVSGSNTLTLLASAGTGLTDNGARRPHDRRAAGLGHGPGLDGQRRGSAHRERRDQRRPGQQRHRVDADRRRQRDFHGRQHLHRRHDRRYGHHPAIGRRRR